MAPHDPGPPPRPSRTPAAAARPGHHLASVAHHFFSGATTSAKPAPGALTLVLGAGPLDGAARVAALLGATVPPRTSPAVVVGEPRHLAAVENLRGGCAGLLPERVVLVWCPDDAAAASLIAVRDLGRWVRALRPRAIEILVLATDDSGGGADLGRVRSRAGRIAPGVPLRLTRCAPERLPAVVADVEARLGEASGTGRGP